MADTQTLNQAQWCKLPKIILLLLIHSTLFAQQDQLFTQFWNINTCYNPANSGLFYRHQAGINYRNQWVGINGAPSIIVATYNTKVDKFRSGIGFNYMYETIGNFKQNRLDVNYSYQVDFGNEQKLSLGASASIAQLFNIFYDNGNFTPAKGAAFLVNFGIIYKTKKLTLGLSSTQLNEERIEQVYFQYRRHYYFSASYDFKLSEQFLLKPQLLLRTDGLFFSTDLNVLATYKKQYWLGITSRNINMFCFSAGVDFKEKYRIGYSYDLPSSQLVSISNGSHEIVLGFLLK